MTVPASGLVTVRLRFPVAAPAATSTATLIDVDVTETTVAVTPVPAKATVRPGWNPLPLIVMTSPEAPRAAEVGVSEVTAGLTVTLKQATHVTVPVSGLVIVRSRAPTAAAPVTVTVRVIEDGLVTVTESTVMPVEENFAVAPGRTQSR